MIELRELTKDNWIECVFLTTNQEDKHEICEEFVASNALSLAQSKVEAGWVSKAIYAEETMVGFTMYGYCEKHQFYEVCRLMIDHRYQGKGYGKAALAQVIEEMKKVENCQAIYLSVDPENEVARRFYEQFDFEATGQMLEGECLYVLKQAFQFENQFDVLSGERVTLKIIEKHPGNKVLIPFYYYDIYEKKSNQPIGKISVRIGCNEHSYYNGHIGYEIDEAYRGHRYSLEAAQLVLQVAKFHQRAFIYVTCRESNQASRKIIELLGGNLLEIATIPTSYFAWHEGIEAHCIYQVNLQ